MGPQLERSGESLAEADDASDGDRRVSEVLPPGLLHVGFEPGRFFWTFSVHGVLRDVHALECLGQRVGARSSEHEDRDDCDWRIRHIHLRQYFGHVSS